MASGPPDDIAPCIWGSITIGFLHSHVNFRNRKFTPLRCFLVRDNGYPRISILLAKSKNDQVGLGVTRTLASTPNVIFHGRGLMMWISKTKLGS